MSFSPPPSPRYTAYDRDLSEEILAVVLKCVSAEQQDGYVRQLEEVRRVAGCVV
jgi:hypothetical protein